MLIKSSFFKKAVPIVFYGLLIVFLVVYLKQIDYDTLLSINIHWEFVAIATLIGLSFRFWGAYVWVVLLRLLGAHGVRFTTSLLHVYAKAWLGRYIPGSAAWILGKIYFAAQHGISKNKLAVSSMLEAALQIIIQMILSLLLLGFDPRLEVISPELRLLMIAATIMLCTFLIPAVFNRFISVVYKVVKKKTFPSEHLTTKAIVIRGAGLYTIGTILNSFSLYFIALSIYPQIGVESMLFVMGASVLAGAASMLAVFAPSGLGVREGIQLALLSIIMPTEYALAITVFTRLWSVGVDLIFYSYATLAKQLRSSSVS